MRNFPNKKLSALKVLVRILNDNVTVSAGRESYRRSYPMDVLKSSSRAEQTLRNSKSPNFIQAFKIDDEPPLKKYSKGLGKSRSRSRSRLILNINGNHGN